MVSLGSLDWNAVLFAATIAGILIYLNIALWLWIRHKKYLEKDFEDEKTL